ncbi:FecR family protein [Sphingobium aquiterrae]|uniref:FecR family protein n=1 Tax=Sphingobium aquiterrae TaxID=2038656 RepID=UPI00301AA992
MGSDKAGGELIATATEWLIALDAGRADPQSFEAWRSADPRHAAAFAQMAATWERTGALRLSAMRPDMPPVETRDHGQASEEAVAPTFSRRRLLAGAGLCGLLAATGGTTLLLRQRRERVQTAVGERRTIRLPDGSLAELNTDSLLSWRFDKSRSVWLERGEAAIAVAANAILPFILHGGDVEARLTQGRYNLRLYDDGPELIALSGGGEIRRPDASRLALAPMHVLSGREGSIQTAKVSPNDADTVSAWRRGEIIFNGMPLDQAVAEFNRYLDKKLVVGDPAIGMIRLGGRFFVDDPASFLRSLQQGFDIEANVGPQSIILLAA